MALLDFLNISPAPSNITTQTQNTTNTTTAVTTTGSNNLCGVGGVGEACAMNAGDGNACTNVGNGVTTNNNNSHSYHQMEYNDSCENHVCNSCQWSCCDYYLHPVFCAKLFFWPCQCGVALTNAALQWDWEGCAKVIFCCPCRLCCDWYPTEAEKLERNSYQKSHTAVPPSSGTPTLVRRRSNSSRHGNHASNNFPNSGGNIKDPYPEPSEIPYERVFEMERKKREILGTSAVASTTTAARIH